MTTYFGNDKDNTWTFQWAAVVTIDGLGGMDTLRLGTSKRTDYKLMQAEDGAIILESVSRASEVFKGTLYNIERLVFDNGKDVMELTAGGGLNKVEGDGVNALITGTDAADHLVGTALDERLVGGLGNDLLDGGAGIDTATYSAQAENYGLSWTKATGWKVTFDGPVAAVMPPPPTEGTDALIGIERIEFADRTIHIDSAAVGLYSALPDALYHFFVVAFGAPPGVTYMNQLAEAYNAGMSVKAIVEVFITKPQFTDVYSLSLSDRELAQLLVANVIDNSATAAVKAEAVEDLVAAFGVGMSRSDVIYTVFGNLANMPASDLKYGGVANLFRKQIEVSKTYTEYMEQSTDDLTTLKSVLGAMSVNSATDSQEQRVDLILAGLMGDQPDTQISASRLTTQNRAEPPDERVDIDPIGEPTWPQYYVDF